MCDNFRLNPIDKIDKIEDAKVKAICTIAINEAQKNINISRNIAEERVVLAIRQNILQIL